MNSSPRMTVPFVVMLRYTWYSAQASRILSMWGDISGSPPVDRFNVNAVGNSSSIRRSTSSTGMSGMAL